MLYENCIPGMKVKVIGGNNCVGVTGLITRLCIRSNERSRKEDKYIVFSQDDENYDDNEGYYIKTENLELVELPESFEKRNEVYDGTGIRNGGTKHVQGT